MRRPYRRLAPLLLGALVLTSCDAGSPSPPPAPPTGATAVGPTSGAEDSAWPQPWAQRPVLDLTFDVADDLASVAGTETIAFTPDLPVCELVFRLWANKPALAQAGSGTRVTSAAVDGAPVTGVVEAAGAPDQAVSGTLFRLPLPACVAAGDTVTAELQFVTTLGPDVDERVGHSTRSPAAWFATAFPLLAWERGQGWDDTPAVPVAGEMAESEDFQLDSLRVSAPAGLQIQGTGARVGEPETTAGRTTAEFEAPAVRDVAVYVGEYDVLVRQVEGVTLHVATPRGRSRGSSAQWADVVEESLSGMVGLLGPYPYTDLWITIVESDSSGIEYPGGMQVTDGDPEEQASLVSHELAHMWFYGLVGNDQGRDPWLDESFATYAQRVVDESRGGFGRISPDRIGDVGRSIGWFTRFRDPSSVYYDRVYTVGGRALVEARDRAGSEEFDAAIRNYLRDNAWTVARPVAVREAFADLPEVLDLLDEVGAFPADPDQ